ncbi:putative membrane-bound mannosyltransferase [Pontibacter aydingkolensis]|uniref:Uncharacterized protein n=1 Tax=Pontibacter aydingkolensis TaxID=1911536 RepID=A0ABS7CQW3_9BACT|nr:hypothetical protein [Pontibacter aydingkolensis]MBW7466204.1 hypothetical protein [Pontibacter aydingkolensis]
MNIQNAIQRLANNKEYYSSIAEVTAVNGNTCDVLLLREDLELFDVRLSAGEGKGFVVTPKVGSKVLVSYLNETNAFVSMVETAELYTIQTENESLKAILSDFFDAIGRMTVTTAMGPSGTPINAMDFTNLKTRLNKLLKE